MLMIGVLLFGGKTTAENQLVHNGVRLKAIPFIFLLQQKILCLITGLKI